ncbi:ras-related and estrogen-regulated growth inhibitor-like [Dendronephthya gigantea]|uniref:ras-related and estrogen-regulated growth inhibitor-like n=1 Tax=Dendronephthya gigantea TaxID=151771 RepID=UPI00106B728E|nr:ras-related and estrogen-regulated growth inhibitor-like [Dendronephthya gigantea]
MSNETGEIMLSVFGAPKVGKSALTVRLLTKRFIGEYDSSSVSTYRGEIRHEAGETLKFSILDYPANLKEFTPSLLNSCDCCVVVYSITDSNSFNEAINYVQTISEFRDSENSEVIILLLGNKRDLVGARKVTYEEGKSVAARLDCVFFEVSAAEDYFNVQTVFKELLLQVRKTRLAEKRQRKLSAKKKAVNKLFGFGGRTRSGTL